MKPASREIVESLTQVRADKFRHELGYGSAPIQNMVEILENQGALVLKRPASEKLSGVFLRAGSVSMVLVNSGKSLGHQQFTLAHELSHHLFDKALNFSLNDADWSEHEVKEAYANSFAGHFLMPQGAVLKDWWDMGLNSRDIMPVDVVHLAQKWYVSYGAMCLRLLKARKVDKDDYYRLLRSPVRQVTLRLGYGATLVDPTGDSYVSRQYLKTAIDALDSGLISEGKLREVLSLVDKDLPDVGIDAL